MPAYAFFKEPLVTVYSEPNTFFADKPEKSAISDETCYGQICRVLTEEGAYAKVVMDIGYVGYAPKAQLLPVSEKDAMEALKKERFTVTAACADVMNIPSVTGIRLLTVHANAILQMLPWDSAQEGANGWSPVALLDGRTGYIPTKFLEEIRYDETTVFRFDGTGSFDEAAAGKPGTEKDAVEKLRTTCLEKYWDKDEMKFRMGLCEVAKKYLGIQYRWGGRSGAGIDCSGLVSTAYRRCGIHIYRDAKIVEGWPMHQITLEEAKPGDALYFPGHIALYLGNGSYIHSTARAGSNGVVINSLNPEAPDYREDLVKSLYAVGTIF